MADVSDAYCENALFMVILCPVHGSVEELGHTRQLAQVGSVLTVVCQANFRAGLRGPRLRHMCMPSKLADGDTLPP